MASGGFRPVKHIALQHILDHGMPPLDEPMLITGCEELIPMHLTSSYFASVYPNQIVSLEEGLRKVPFHEFLSMDNMELRKMYLRNVHLSEIFPDEYAKCVFPAFLGKNHLQTTPYPVPAQWRNWFELFISSKDCPGFPYVHCDTCFTHAFSMQVQGVKQFDAFPPSDGAYLYPYGTTTTRSEVPDIDNVDLERFPLFAKTHRYQVQLHAGEILLVPSNWWHTAKSVSEEASITLGGNFVLDNNLDNFSDAFCDYSAALSLIKKGAAFLN